MCRRAAAPCPWAGGPPLTSPARGPSFGARRRPAPPPTRTAQGLSYNGAFLEDLSGRLAAAPAAATLYFADDGTVTAWTGCEAGAGTWSVADGALSVELTRGVPLCDDGTGLLALLADDLRSVRAVDGGDGTRTLLGEDGRVLAVLRRP